MSDAEARVSAADQVEILDLYARYNRTIDTGDIAAWLSVFDPEGELRMTAADRTFRGTEQLERFAAGHVRRSEGRQRHFTSNIELRRGDGGLVLGRAYLMVTQTEADSGARIVATGAYDDLLARGSDGWLFLQRALRIDAAPAN
jgi:3-phenylpropionate/cinnamic acid dioxygenase small subunit